MPTRPIAPVDSGSAILVRDWISAQGRDEAQDHHAADHRDLVELAERAAADAEKLLSIARRPLRRTQVKVEALAAVGGKTPLRVGGEGGCAGR